MTQLESSEYPDVRVVFIVEPDGLANLVTNLSVAKCANAQSTYEVISYLCYAKALNTHNIIRRNLCRTPFQNSNRTMSGCTSMLATLAG